MMKSRRGISSVVGAVFAIIALSTVIGYITYSMNVLSNYNQSVLIRTQQMTDIANEKFQVGSVSYVNNKFSIIVNNTGSLPINFTKIWITNKTTSACNTYSCNINYVPNKVVVPGNGTILGQKMSGTIDTTKPYNVKIVTSRGNSQQFTVNSVGTAPVNIQLLAIPSSFTWGFKTALVMVVTNNQTATLFNVAPNTPSNSNSAVCTLGSVTPANYNTLPPGGTAVFKWDVTGAAITGSCTFTVSPTLQGGYAQTVQATIDVQPVTFAETNLAQSSGILTLNYSSFRWAETGQGGTWKTGFSFPHGQTAAFRLNVTNNNVTGTFYLSKKADLLFYSTHISPSQQPTPFYIVNVTNTSTMVSTTYNNCNGQSDYCLGIGPGQTVRVYLAANAIGTSTAQSFSNVDINTSFLLIFGKFSSCQTCSASEYAQNIPYIASDVT